MLYSAYGDETGVQCALGCLDQTRVSALLHCCIGLLFDGIFCVCFSLQEFVKGCGSFTKRLVDDLLNKMTAGDHSKAIIQIRQVLK